ncbi:hypothetical protein GCM10007350_22240 [Jeongeupia chitinilytica]|uniref:Uncharacterized protein n=1 Tax=Jeongeupia chitinilytica TaxID=1041641 RepID=A0ABQ3H2B6_9NEIS|nr:hypothetical protein GCM10007350_22240 [Jeongeupia chitinilytica]
MSQASPGEEWQTLCEEHRAARKAQLAAFTSVNAKFLAIGAGTSTANPTQDESIALEAAWERLQDVRARMTAFVKAQVA